MNKHGAIVYIIDDNPSFRKSMERLVTASGFKVISFESANAFLAESHIQRPSCLLLDVQLPGIDGLHLQEKLIAKGSNLPIIFMTGHGNIKMGVQAMKRGAIDFLPKPFEPKDLRNAITKALDRDIAAIKKEAEAHEVKDLLSSLTPRENEVLRWVITGKLNKQIADVLGTTEKTIKVHRGRVMHKTKASSVADLVRLTEKVGIVPASV